MASLRSVSNGTFPAETTHEPTSFDADEADQIASRLESDFLDAGELGDIWMMDATAMEGRAVDGLWRVQVRVGWKLYG